MNAPSNSYEVATMVLIKTWINLLYASRKSIESVFYSRNLFDISSKKRPFALLEWLIYLTIQNLLQKV